MKHEHPEHFVEHDAKQMLKNARQDQIKRLLQDIGFVAGTQDGETTRDRND